MTIEIKRNAGETTIELVGRLDTTTAPALDKTINEDIGDVAVGSEYTCDEAIECIVTLYIVIVSCDKSCTVINVIC